MRSGPRRRNVVFKKWEKWKMLVLLWAISGNWRGSGRFGLGWVPPGGICEHFVVSGSRNIMVFMYVGNDDASPNYSSHKRGWITFI